MDEDKMADIDIIRKEVANLYTFRDKFFMNHSFDDAHLKDEEVQKELEKTLVVFNKLRENVATEHRGEVQFLYGRAHNVGSEYNEIAEQELGRATKFNLHSAWNELGECLYKKGNLTSARTCFEKALAITENKIYFRNMSMLMRSLPWKVQNDRKENVEKGVEYAKCALKQDVTDGHSWLVLGNSYLSSFFTVDARNEILRNCKAAYAKAEEDSIAVLLPELHYSKYQVQWYEEDYTGALKSLWKAHHLEPTWTECRTKYDQGWTFLTKLSDMIQTKGQLNKRRLTTLIGDIKPIQLGPFEKGGSTLTDNKQPTLVMFRQLHEGSNQDKIVQGKVVCTVIPDSGIPFSFCLVDREGSCIAITVYNWADGCGVKIADSVAVVAPVLRSHSITALHLDKTIEFKSIRVAVPVMLVINKRRVTAGQVATSQIVSEHKPE